MLAIVYMAMHNRTTIKRQGDNSMYVFGAASFITMCILLAPLYISQRLRTSVSLPLENGLHKRSEGFPSDHSLKVTPESCPLGKALSG